MANKNERIMAWEISQMADKIRPLTGIFCQSAIVHFNKDTPRHERDHYEDKYEKAVSHFWEYNAKTFDELLTDRPKY